MKIYLDEKQIHKLNESWREDEDGNIVIDLSDPTEYKEENRFEVCQVEYNGITYIWQDKSYAQPFFGFFPNEAVVKEEGTTHGDYNRLFKDEYLCLIGRIWFIEDKIFIVYSFCGNYYVNYSTPSMDMVIRILKEALKKSSFHSNEVYFCNDRVNPNNPMPLREEMQEHPEEWDEFMIGGDGTDASEYRHVMKEEKEENIEIGISINCNKVDFADLILNHGKVIETRNGNKNGLSNLSHYIGHRVALVKTQTKHKPCVFGYATIGEPKHYKSEEEFNQDKEYHKIDTADKHFEKYKWKEGKLGYPLVDFKPCKPFDLPKWHGTNLRYTSTYLKESVTSEVYHYTSLDSLVNILGDDKFLLHYDYKENMYYLSVTRQHNSTIGYPSGLATAEKSVFKENIVRLTLNGDALNQRYKGKPVNFFNTRQLSHKADAQINSQQWAVESEDRIYNYDDSIPNATNYITRIDVIFRKEPSFYIYSDVVNALQWLVDNEFDYITHVYFEEKDSNTMNKHKQLTNNKWKNGISCEDAIQYIYESEDFDLEENRKIDENFDIEVTPSNVDTSSFEIQDSLQPNLWDGDTLDGRARLQLLDIVDDFIETLNIKWVKPKDILLTGSICNFNWSQYSDIDVHILIDYTEVDERTELVKEYFDAKKNEWNNEHTDLKIYGFPIEMYVQDTNEFAESKGIYSLEKNEWLQEPQADDFDNLSQTDDEKVKLVSSSIMTEIDNLCDAFEEEDDIHRIEQINKKAEHISKTLKAIRIKGLEKDGEMSVGNIIYKELRRTEYLDKLWDLISKSYDRINSINENKIIKEYLSKNVGKPLDDLLNGEYSYRSEMNDSGKCFYWNGTYSKKQKEYLINHFGKLFPDYMLEKNIEFDDADEEGEYYEYWENLKDRMDDNDEYEGDYNKDLFRNDEMTFLLKSEYSKEADEFGNYVANFLSSYGNNAKHYLPNWFYLQPIDSKNGYKLIKNGWMVHFTNKDNEILRNNYFYGADLDTLSITLGGDRGDYVFAFDADILSSMIGNKWGNDAKNRPLWFGKNFVMFQAVGVLVNHSGDHFHQVIADRNTIKNIIHIKNINDEYCVLRNNNLKPIFKNKDYAIVIKWVMENFVQYHKKINNGDFLKK